MLNIEDTDTVSYALRKLTKLGLLRTLSGFYDQAARAEASLRSEGLLIDIKAPVGIIGSTSNAHWHVGSARCFMFVD